MKVQRKVEVAPQSVKEMNRRSSQSARRQVNPESKPRTNNILKDRKAQYLQKEQEGALIGTLIFLDFRKPHYGTDKLEIIDSSRPLRSNSSRVNQRTTRIASCENALVSTVQTAIIPEPIRQGKENEQDTDISEKYNQLLEKYKQQGKLVTILEEQLSGLRTLIEECTGENQQLVNMLKEKETREANLLKDIESIRKQSDNDKQERERYFEEKAIHEQIVQRLNRKLSVSFDLIKIVLEI